VITNLVQTTNQSFTLPGSLANSGTLIEVAMTNHPYAAVSKTIVGSSGWAEGLPIATEDWAKPLETGTVARQRWTWTNWTQDNAAAGYKINPRVIETRVGDGANTKKTQVDYELVGSTNVAVYGRVSEVRLYDTNLTTILKKVITDYEDGSAYLSKRLVNLPVLSELRDGSDVLWSKATYAYDGEAFDQETNQVPGTITQHDAAYGSSFVAGRGNLTSVTRHDVTGQTASVTSKTRYDIAGSVVPQLDPLNRKVRFEYDDVFNDTTTTRNTFAYPTKIYDPAGNYSQVKYRFDLGANVWAKGPNLNATTQGKETTREYDDKGRILNEKIENSGAYTRYEYPTNGIQSKVFSTIVDTNANGADSNDEVLSETWSDGAGRVRRTKSEHPGSETGLMGTLIEYDILGRVIRSTVPTEIAISGNTWTPDGDDDRGLDQQSNPVWLWNAQEYDWMGRVTRNINTDGTDTRTEYDGCGCAGSTIVMLKGESLTEGRRTQKVYSDIFNREVKRELLDWNSAVYKTATHAYNGRDQITSTKVYAGTTSATEFRETTFSFDGHGRLESRHEPQQNPNSATEYEYFADDKPETITDARGAAKHYAYNSRGLIDEISWTVPPNSSIQIPTTVQFEYDEAGNRKELTDGSGNVVYAYNSLSQLVSETREFNEYISQSPTNDNKFKIEYTYALSGKVASYKEPFGEIVTYGFDRSGRIESVSGNRTVQNQQVEYVTSAKYRAWGGPKSITYSQNAAMTMSYNNRLLAQQYEFGKYDFVNGGAVRMAYTFYSDGRLKTSDTDYNGTGSTWEPFPNFDRSYEYDFLGRLTEARTGEEARSFQNENAWPTERPYRLVRNYNQFGDVTSQERLHWFFENRSTYNFQNSRMVETERINVLPGDVPFIVKTWSGLPIVKEIADYDSVLKFRVSVPKAEP